MNQRTSRLALALAVVGVGLLVLAGCGRVRRDAGAPSSDPATTAVSTPTAGATQSTQSTSAVSAGTAAVDPQQLAQITAELGTVDSQIAGASSDVDAATNAINSQEGDPSK